MAGICSYGGYVPWYRLERKQIYKRVGWLNPATIGNAKGEKAICNFDEDAITLAVAASIGAMNGFDRAKVEGLYFASTSMPFTERLNAGIITAALGMKDQVRAADFTGSLKAGTSALLASLEAVGAGSLGHVMICGSDCRMGKPASPQEMIFGDAAAAFLVGDENVIAEFKGAFSTTHDFVDHFRGAGAETDRQWEDRWIRDLGYVQLIPEVVEGLLNKTGFSISDFSKIIYPCTYPAARKEINKILGITPEIEQTNLQAEIGESGAAHSLVMLVAALEEAKPGDRIMVVSFGNGCDALCFEVTDKITELGPMQGISGCLQNKVMLDEYSKYLVWRDILPVDKGLRSEEDEPTRWSLVWRMRKEVYGLWGSKCTACGTVQYPPQRICVNPECEELDQSEPYLFSDKLGKVASFTGDMLSPSLNPPAIYGQVEFEGGGKYLFDLTDCELEDVKTGMQVSMSFRRKYRDEKRGISGYFWKAVPVKEVKKNGRRN